jgi:hypothetical protein
MSANAHHVTKSDISPLWPSLKRFRRSAAVVFITVAMGLLFASQAHAQVIRACVQRSSLQVRIVGPTEACRSTETLVTWNQQGLKGDKGDQGDKGDKGDQGDKGDTGSSGTPGLSGYELATVTHSLPRLVSCPTGTLCLFEWVQLTAYCSPGKTVLSGSNNYFLAPLPLHQAPFEAHDGVGNVFGSSGVWQVGNDASRPLDDGSGWRVYSSVKSPEQDDQPFFHLRVTAVCAFVS